MQPTTSLAICLDNIDIVSALPIEERLHDPNLEKATKGAHRVEVDHQLSKSQPKESKESIKPTTPAKPSSSAKSSPPKKPHRPFEPQSSKNPLQRQLLLKVQVHFQVPVRRRCSPAKRPSDPNGDGRNTCRDRRNRLRNGNGNATSASGSAVLRLRGMREVLRCHEQGRAV